jgi:hypothetical protein
VKPVATYSFAFILSSFYLSKSSYICSVIVF